MADIKGVKSPFVDHVASPMDFVVVPTKGLDPMAKPVLSTSATPSTSVTPKELPENNLFFGPKS